MTEPLNISLLDLSAPEECALFLDFDGTLVEFADHPADVRLDSGTRKVLGRLTAVFEGAVAIITGRDINEIDRFLDPIRLPVAGVHGLTRRDAGGRLHSPEIDGTLVRHVQGSLGSLADQEDGIILEVKNGSVALHYRMRPELELICIEAMESAVSDLQGIHLMRGKMVIEAKADPSNKGGAVSDFLSEPPFAGRIPVFVGDDITDEDAFQEVNTRKGVSIKVGGGETCARYRAQDTAKFLEWLTETVKTFRGDGEIEQP